MKTHESAEDYLETILLLKRVLGEVRSIDIANEMNFTKPSVSVAMKKLKEQGYITIEEGGYISLTPSGLELAECIYERHELISGLLMHIGVSKETAMEDACRIEHVISTETFEKLKAYDTETIK
ncbi:MAG: metal-dependent transcriptional regulator [Oscillospiraceae bacterium]|nr:metal-dependent transcriptional regulator [Oscillospiraceae bacterium]